MFLRLVLRQILRHKLRAFLTVASLTVALLLLVTLRTLITTIASGIEAASASRLVVQSAVSLFVDLPQNYQTKIAQIPGIERTCKWQWFGAYYQDERNTFSQFAVDPDTMFDVYPELDVIEGDLDEWRRNRRGCVIGDGLVRRFGWKVGDTVPLIGILFPHPDGHDVAWEFEVEAIYHPTVRNFDSNGFFFHYEYFEQTLEQGETGTPGIGTIVLDLEPGAEPTAVMAAVDGMFENGPQRVQTTSEAEFQAQFISMFGNIPFFLSAIGGAVFFAILLACVNTMLMAGREQTKEIGTMKALGFSDGRMFLLLIAQALLLCGLGGGFGVLLGFALSDFIAGVIGAMFPGYHVEPATLALGLGITLAVGLIAGLTPAWRANRLRVVDALSATE